MTALDDAIAKADEVLARDHAYVWMARDAKYFARVVKAVAEALDEAEAGYSMRRYTVGDIRAAIERRLTEGK